MIYTTYFAKLKKLPDNVVPIAICRWLPEQLRCTCFHYKELAPPVDIYTDYKHTGDTVQFTNSYTERVLSKLDPHYIEQALRKWVGDRDFALVCYEKSSDFCHRHLVAEWLRKAGYVCEEFDFKINIPS